VGLDDGLGDGQSEPRAAVAALTGGVGAIEAVEDVHAHEKIADFFSVRLEDDARLKFCD